MLTHEPAIYFTTPIWGRAIGITEIASNSKDSGRPVQTVPSHMATGRWIQYQGGWANGQPPLHERPQMGEAFSIRRLGGPEGPEATRSSQNSHWTDRRAGYQGRHVSTPGFGAGIYYLVLGEAGKAPESASPNSAYQSRDNPSDPCPPWTSFSYGSNLVPKHRSRIRGKKNAIIRIYRHRPRWGQVVCFDEMGPLQTIPRGGKAWGKRAKLRPDRYKRNGTLQWFSAFSPHTGLAVGKGFPSKSSQCCTAFWLEHMLPFWPRGGIHLVMDNLSAHKKALRELPARVRRRIKVYYTPTNSSWLNLIESYFATLQRTALHNTDYRTPDEIEHGLQRGTQYLNENPRIYKWKKI